MTRSLWLVGMMGAGKSAVARKLAPALSLRFSDTDTLVEEMAGRSVSEIWEAEGEAGFRLRERAALSTIAAQSGMVVATGGGVVLEPENLTTMKESGMVVWLDSTPRTLAERIGRSIHRPLLSGHDLVARLTEIDGERRPLYEAACNHRLATDRLTIDEVAAQVEELWNGS